MTITRARLFPGEDLHLLPGMVSPRLDQLLWVDDVDNGVTRTYRFIDGRPPTVTVSFEANFDRSDPRTAGVDVEPNFGEITVDAALPAPERLLDFLVIATVRSAASVLATTWIRVRIHDGVRAVWLTPEQLTVHRPSNAFPPALASRLSILAEFTDGQYGDLTNWLPDFALTDPTDRRFARTIAQRDAPLLVWQSSTGAVLVDTYTGWLLAQHDGDARILVTSAALPAIQGFARAEAAPPWDTHVDLQLLDGPGIDRLYDVTNVLLLPEGFTEDERGEFQRLVRQLVHRWRVRRRTRPFDLVKDRVNYWTAWVASPQAGVSVLEEIETAGPVTAPVPAPCAVTAVHESAVAAAHHVGVPAQNTTRFLLNERDTAFHVAIGGRPGADANYVFRWPHLDGDRRIKTPSLNEFFYGLRDPRQPGLRLGRVWMRPDPADLDPLRGKDETQVVFICRYHRVDGATIFTGPAGRHVCVSLCVEDQALHRVKPNPVGAGVDLVPDALPARIPLSMWSVCAHELCHTFGLGDEYGSDYPGRDRAAPAIALTADMVGTVHAYANIQERADLLTGGSLDADRIKWLWPRIEKAGVLAEPADPIGASGGQFRLRLEPGHADAFAPGDVVRLRRRPLISAGPPSFRLRVTAVEDDALLVEPDEDTPNAESLLLDYYVGGTVVMAPVRGPDSGSIRGDDLLLVHESALAMIDAAHNPLNADPDDGPDRPCTEVLTVNTPTAATLFLDEPPRPPRHSGLRVGLYENGGGFDIDVYRPTGMCFMRTSRVFTALDHAGEELRTADERRYHRFCPVCRYVLVDRLDPTQHGRIDRDYGETYPP